MTRSHESPVSDCTEAAAGAVSFARRPPVPTFSHDPRALRRVRGGDGEGN